MPLISSANIACGGHAGNESTMRAAVELALRNKVAIGAHPGYPDRERFGRVALEMPQRDLVESIRRQIDLLVGIASRLGARVTHVKAHGALYNQAERDPAAARTILFGIQAAKAGQDVVVFAPPGSAMYEEAKATGMAVAREGFGDSALLVELGDRVNAKLVERCRALAEAWEDLGHGPAVPAYASVLVRFDPRRLDPLEAERGVSDALARSTEIEPTNPRTVEIPTRYDGPDLAETASASGVDTKTLVRLHSERDYVAFFLGFLPGFAYCGTLDARIVAPRLARPHERVPAGSVAVPDGQPGFYPFA